MSLREHTILKQLRDSIASTNSAQAVIVRPYYDKLMALPDDEYLVILDIIYQLMSRCEGLGAVSAMELIGVLSDKLASGEIKYRKAMPVV